MSWEEGNIPGTIGIYHGNRTGFSGTPLRSIGNYFIDLLNEKVPTVEDRGGTLDITYTWANSQRQQTKLDIPAVSIMVTAREDWNQLNSALNFKGTTVPGKMMIGTVTLFILAYDKGMRDDMENIIDGILDKHINYLGHPQILYFRRVEDAEDRGFGMTDRFVLNTVWQTASEDTFFKILTFRFGMVQDYISEDDEVGGGIVGSVQTDLDDDQSPVGRFGSINLKVDFTPIT